MKQQKTFYGANYKQIMKRFYMSECLDGIKRGRTIFTAKGRLFECGIIFTSNSLILTQFGTPRMEIIK